MATKEKTNEKTIARAKLAFTRQSPRKVRRTANLLRNLTAGEAMTQLEFMPYEAAGCLKKLIGSAMANATHNLEVENPGELKISQLLVDESMTYKRWRAMSKGRAYSIMKRSSKVSVALSEMTAAEFAKHVWDTSPRNKKNSKSKDKKEAKEIKKSEPKAKKTEAKDKPKKTASKAKTTKAKKSDSNEETKS
jgi:large subunit ribosomal protein L22